MSEENTLIKVEQNKEKKEVILKEDIDRERLIENSYKIKCFGLIIFIGCCYFLPPIYFLISKFIKIVGNLFVKYPNLPQIIWKFIIIFPSFGIIKDIYIKIASSFLFSLLLQFVFYKMKFTFLDYYFFKFIFFILTKLHFLPFFILSFILSYILVEFLFALIIDKFGLKKGEKIFTFKDAEYLEDFLKNEIPLFVLFSKDNNKKDFFLKILTKISIYKKGKFHFVYLNYNEEIEKKIYSKVFKDKLVEFPQFALIHGEKVIIMKNNNKEIDQKNIDKFVEDFEVKQIYEEEEKEKEKQSLKFKEEEGKNIDKFEESIE